MVALECREKGQVDRIYEIAMSKGGADEGPPGQRWENFYAAYFRDPDGNKLNAFVMG
jgi:predicted lactoylglutathione lyase